MSNAILVQSRTTNLDYFNSGSADIAANSVVVAGNLVGVAPYKIPANTLGALQTFGVYAVELAASTAVTLGASVYWDATGGKATTTATNNAYLGVAVKSASSGDATVTVALNLGSSCGSTGVPLTMIAPAFSASSTYASGDACVKDGKLYKCTTAISTAAAWDATDWTETTVSEI